MNLKSLMAISFALGFLGGAPAQADTSYPASLCHADTPSGRPVISREDNGVFNRSRVTQTISCPIMRDITEDTDGVFVRVQVSGRVTCELNARDAYGQVGPGPSRDTKQHSGNGFGAIDLRTDRSHIRGPYEFLCFLPSNAGITSYYVDE